MKDKMLWCRRGLRFRGLLDTTHEQVNLRYLLGNYCAKWGLWSRANPMELLLRLENGATMTAVGDFSTLVTTFQPIVYLELRLEEGVPVDTPEVGYREPTRHDRPELV